jgi:hypothetical protein
VLPALEFILYRAVLKSIREGKVMVRYILVPLNPIDPVEEIMPCIEKIAQAEMTVIFLIPYRRNGLFEEHCLKTELSAKGLATDPDALMRHQYEQQIRLADEKITVARETLRGRGVKVMAHVHMDRLRPLLKKYKRNGGVYRVLIRQRKPIWINGSLRGIAAFFSLFKRCDFSPTCTPAKNLG